MRPILTLILTISVTTFTASSWAEIPKDKWEGYKPVSEAELPPKVKEFAENSVFFMQTVDATPAPGSKIEILDFEKDKDDPRIKIRVTDPKTLRTDLTAMQVETCRKQKLKRCPIATKVARGTIFVNNGKFYTCRHGFHNWLALAASENNKSVTEITPPMIFSKPANGKSGKVVYNSAYDAKPMLEFDVINDSPELNSIFYDSSSNGIGKNRFLFDTDFIEMSLPSSASVVPTPSLPVENLSITNKNESIFSLGYPAKTEFSSLGENNAKGVNLSATHGYVRGYYAEFNLFYASNFGSSGMSGGPVVTESGKLVGMNCSSFYMEKSATNPDHVAAGFFQMDTNKMNAFWNSIDLAQESAQEESTSVVN